MSGGKGYKPPPAPDPYKVAAAQQSMNVNTALAQSALNQVEEVTPFGRSYYEPTGDVRTFGDSGESTGGFGLTSEQARSRGFIGNLMGAFGSKMGGRGSGGQSFSIPTMRRVTELSPEQRRIYEAEAGLTGDFFELGRGYIGRVAEGLEDPFTFEGLPEAPEASEEARQQVIDALYGQYTSRIDPEMEQRRRALEQRLANQGISIGSDAWGSEMDRFSRGRNDAYTSALNQAVTSGGAEQSRLFGLQQSARERAIQERAYLRDRPINEITALTSGRGMTMPQFSPTPQGTINPADYQGAAYNSYAGQLKAAEIASEARSALIGSLAGMTGKIGAAAVSDKRLKEDIQSTGISVDGVPIKTWKWKDTGETDIGAVAQDVHKKRPDAAVTFSGGIKGVNYSRLFGLGGA